jgi:hypothetical protein
VLAVAKNAWAIELFGWAIELFGWATELFGLLFFDDDARPLTVQEAQDVLHAFRFKPFVNDGWGPEWTDLHTVSLCITDCFKIRNSRYYVFIFASSACSR